jgi:hypothetical protein
MYSWNDRWVALCRRDGLTNYTFLLNSSQFTCHILFEKSPQYIDIPIKDGNIEIPKRGFYTYTERIMEVPKEGTVKEVQK